MDGFERGKRELEQQLKAANELLKKMKSEKEDDKKHRDSVERELAEVRGKLKIALDENVGVRAEIDKGVEDIAKALGDGYGRCLARVSTVGFDSAGHTFEDYIRDFAA